MVAGCGIMSITLTIKRAMTNLKYQLSEAEAELDDLYSMSEEAACFRYNTNTKEDAITMVREWIEGLIEQVEHEQEEKMMEEARITPQPYHFAFATESEFWNFKGC